MHNQFTVIITSVIFYKDAPLSYTDVRSVFTPNERAQQTIITINSIRERIPNVRIILAEFGLQKKLPLGLDKLADAYIYLGDEKWVRKSVDSQYKGLGEAMGLIYLNKYLIDYKADFYFKISGRYFLNDNFNLNEWHSAGFICKKYRKNISTRLYGFDSSTKKSWYRTLIKSLPLLFFGKSIEDAQSKFVNRLPIKELKLLGVSGIIAPDGSIIEE